MIMRILHTSDWHLGRQLYNQKRTAEFEAFLGWLIETIEQNTIDTLLVAGDVFDTTTPSASTQEMYYKFLHQASKTSCRNIVIIGGNHDSATLLNAPKQLLRNMNIFVVGEMCDNIEEEVISLYDDNKQLQAIICAVPFLRDRDVRMVQAYESIEEKAVQLVNGIEAHYDQVAKLASEKAKRNTNIPIIAMGHLFTTADRSKTGDGVRELYVGTLAHIGGERFSDIFDYVALGHIHIAQKVGGCDHKRYSGSPIPMGFNEADQTKKVIMISFENGERRIDEIEVPRFKNLYRIAGSAENITQKITDLLEENANGWLEITINEGDTAPDLSTKITNMIEKSELTLLSTKDTRAKEFYQMTAASQEKLEDITPEEVFEKCLMANNVSDELKPQLMTCFDEILLQYNENYEEKE